MSKSAAAYENRRIMAAFVGEEEILPDITSNTLDDYDDSLREIHSMILYSQDINDKEEVAFWRRLEMDVKMQKRKIIEGLGKNMRGAMVYS